MNRLAWSAVRGALVLGHRLGLPDRSQERLVRDLVKLGVDYLRSNKPFDLVLAAPSPLRFGEAMAELAERSSLPLALYLHDPIGARDGTGFAPSEPERQARLLARATGIGYASPMTAAWYAEKFPQVSRPHVFLPDSFQSLSPIEKSESDLADTQASGSLRFVHAGGLRGFRPVGPLAEALAAFVPSQGQGVELVCVGRNDPNNLALLRTVLHLQLDSRPEISYRETRRLLAAFDVLVAIIGPRHLDNVPSKFFEYLAYGKPILVLGPPGNPLQGLISELGVGVFRDASRPLEILDGLHAVTHRAGEFKQAFVSNRSKIDRFESSETARAWAAFFDRCSQRPTSSRETEPSATR